MLQSRNNGYSRSWGEYGDEKNWVAHLYIEPSKLFTRFLWHFIRHPPLYSRAWYWLPHHFSFCQQTDLLRQRRCFWSHCFQSALNCLRIEAEDCVPLWAIWSAVIDIIMVVVIWFKLCQQWDNNDNNRDERFQDDNPCHDWQRPASLASHLVFWSVVLRKNSEVANYKSTGFENW